MTVPVYPVLPGLSFPVERSELWSTIIQESVAGKETRLQKWSYPRHQWKVSYDILRSAAAYQEWQALAGFFNAVGGAAGAFLYGDPDDGSVASQEFGVGDGVTTQFQLVRALGGFVEPVFNINGTPTNAVGGVATSAFTLGSTGTVIFNTAPASGAALTWTGGYYFLCRFVDDSADFSKFMAQLWDVKKLAWISVKQ